MQEYYTLSKIKEQMGFLEISHNGEVFLMKKLPNGCDIKITIKGHLIVIKDDKIVCICEKVTLPEIVTIVKFIEKKVKWL